MASKPRIRETKQFLLLIYSEMFRTRAFTAAAALAFYFMFSLIPMLIFLSALLGFLHNPDFFEQLVAMLATFLPASGMALVRKVLADVLIPNRSILSFSFLGYLWTVTNVFTTTIEVLDVAYDVRRQRSWWRDYLQALLLAFTSGLLTFLSMLGVMAGPHFGHFLTEMVSLPSSFARIWPAVRLSIAFGGFLLGVVLLYYLGPNRKQPIKDTIPGALIAVIGWFLGSFGLDYYLYHFASYTSTYGPLGAVMGLMLWFYMVAFSIILGAESNAELEKRRQVHRETPRWDALSKPLPSTPSC